MSILAEVADPAIPEELDTVFLRLAQPVEPEQLIPLVASFLPRGLIWETFGFPRIRGDAGMWLKGRVDRSLYAGDRPRDLELTCEGIDLPTDYGGFSGSPVIVDGTVRAMLQRRLDAGIGAISVARLHSYLDAAKVTFRSARDDSELSPTLIRELASTIPNNRTLWQIEEEVAQRPDGYLVLTGHPGAGKTLITASFQPLDARISVVGRYFAGGYPGSDLPPTHYRQLPAFASWLSNEAILRSRNAIAVQSSAATTELTASIVDNLKAIASTFDGDDLGVLIIDGVDPSAIDTSPTFVDFLPPNTPEGLVIVITTTDSNALCRRLNHLRISRTLETYPLPLYDCEWLINKRLGNAIFASQAAYVARLSQGHPLTLNYFINEIQNAISQGNQDPLIGIDGGPDDYYVRLWNRLETDGRAQYLLALISRLRGAVSDSELFQILPTAQRLEFTNSFAAIRHLLRVDDNSIQLYHQSFRDFVQSRTANWNQQIHVDLANYCATHAESEYASGNLIYHHLLSSDDGMSASQMCTQEWLDRAASLCVHPEFILADLDEVLRRRMDAGDIVETIRLLLIRSRAHYRYNQVFALFAADFARAAIGLRSPAQSLRFVVRQDRYVCSLDESISILRQLAIGGHNAQAMQLFRDLRIQLWGAYEQGAADYSTIRKHMLATCIVGPCSNDDPSAILTENRRLSSLLNQNLKHSETSDEEKAKTRSSIYSHLGGYFLWCSGFAPSNENNPVELALILDWARAIANEEGITPRHPGRPQVPEGIKILNREEILNALRRISMEMTVPAGAETIIARALMQCSGAFAQVSNLYKLANPVAMEWHLRDDNGVDVNLSSVEQLHFASELEAFTGDVSIGERVVRRTRHTWEDRFFDAAACLGRISGNRYRLRALNERSEVLLIEELKSNLFPLLHFSLKDRSEWEDSYHIPENVVPRLIFYATEVLAEFEPESSAEFATLIIDHNEFQFGLYTEGYQRVLSVAADVLATTQSGELPAADIRRALLHHVSERVFARQERVSSLLNCAQHLAKLGAKSDAETAFQEAIISSLGPNWYKEAQFGLLLDAVQAVDDPLFALAQWKRTIDVLAYASGEATFQRFVCQQKESLIRHLSCQGFFAEALATYQHYVLPSVPLQKARIQRVDVDKVSDFVGNRTGVKEIDEQGGVVALLKGLNLASPIRRWAVIELFWPWGDDRYSPDFVGALCELLRSPDSQIIGERFLRLLRIEVGPERRQHFVQEVLTHDAAGVTAPWLARANELGIIENKVDTRKSVATVESAPPDVNATGGAPGEDYDDISMPGVFGGRKTLRPLKAAIPQSEERINRGDFAGARLLLRDGLRQAQDGGWNIWDEGLPEAHSAIKCLLSGLDSEQEGLRILSECVMAEKHEGDWRIARKLMILAMSQVDADTRRHLFSIIAEHIECLVKPERLHYSIDHEINSFPPDLEAISADDCVSNLLIFLLDHPNKVMRTRVANTLEWLTRSKNLDPQALVRRVVSQEVGDGREIAVGIIQRIVSDDPQMASMIATLEQRETLKNDPSFLARYLVEHILGDRSGRQEPASADTQRTTPRTPIDWTFTSGPLFALMKSNEPAAEYWAREICIPFGPNEMYEVQNVRRQAFGSPSPNRGFAFERESVFRALGDVTDVSQHPSILSAALWNPLWPDRDIRLDAAPIIPGILARIEENELASAFTLESKTILHCFEFQPPDREEPSQTYEAVAVLVPKEYFKGDLDWQNIWEERSVHNATAPRIRVATALATLNEPAVIRFEPELRIGGDFTPALPSEQMIHLAGVGFERVCWRDGRRWDFCGPGPALSGGTALLVESSRLNSIVGYDLVWVIFCNNAPTHIVDLRRQVVYGGSDED